MNKSIVVGNVGQNPTLRYLNDGTPVTTLSVCANDRSGSGENRTDTPVWYKAHFFGNSAEIITKHVKQGDPIYVEGRLKPEPWVGDDGKARVNLNLNRCDFQFLPKRNRANDDADQPAAVQTDTEASSDLSDTDIPF